MIRSLFWDSEPDRECRITVCFARVAVILLHGAVHCISCGSQLLCYSLGINQPSAGLLICLYYLLIVEILDDDRYV